MIVFKKNSVVISLYAGIELTGSTCIYMFWFKRKHVSFLLKSEPRSSSFQLKKPHHGSFVKQDMIDKLLYIDELFVSAENFVNYTNSSALRTILTRHGTFSRT